MKLGSTIFEREISAYAFPSEKLEGEWIAIYPFLDLITQGTGLMMAMSMMDECVAMIYDHAEKHGQNPLEGRLTAPQEHWDILDRLLKIEEYTLLVPENESTIAYALFSIRPVIRCERK